MAVGSLSPVAIQQFFDNNGNPLAGGKLGFYLAGTDTATPAYADVGLTTPLANPVILDAAGRAPELFLAALTYKQVLQNAGGVTLWTADNIVTPTALRSTSGTISLTGLQHNVPIPAGVITFLDCQNTVPLTITGFAGGTPGQILIVRSSNVAPVYLAHFSSSSQVPLYNFVASGPTALAGTHGIAVFVLALGSWILVSHEQGTWLPVPFNAANFTMTGGSGTWTVEAGDVLQMHYRLSGTSLLMSFAIGPTVTTGAPQQLEVGGWPYTFRTAVTFMPGISSVSGGISAWGPMLLNMSANQSKIDCVQTTFGPWIAGTQVYLNAQVLADVN